MAEVATRVKRATLKDSAQIPQGRRLSEGDPAIQRGGILHTDALDPTCPGGPGVP